MNDEEETYDYTMDAMDALLGGKAVDFKDVVHNALQAKAMSAIDTRRQEVAASLFADEDENEDYSEEE